MNTESASLGTVVDSKRVSDLPLSYGNPFLLIGLTAGVTFNGSVRLDRPFEPTHIVNFSMGGTRGNLNDITIDGAPTTATANAYQVTASYVPPTDIVQEFKVQTATFDAQFGQTQGGVTNISIKTGTNAFHGSADYSFPAAEFLGQRLLPEQDRHARVRTSSSTAGAVPSAARCASRRSTTARTRPSSCSAMKASTIRGRAMTTPPTRCRRRPCTTATSPRCSRSGSQYTIYDPATRVAVRRRPLHGNAVPGQHHPASRVRPGRRRDSVLLPDDRKEPGRSRRPEQLPGRQPPRKKPSITTTRGRVDQNLGERQRFFVRYSTYIRNSTYNNYFDNAFVGDAVLVLLEDRGLRSRLHPVADDGPEHALQLQPLHPRLGPAGLGAMGFDLTSARLLVAVHQPGSEGSVRFPRINLTGYISNGSPARTGRSITIRSPPL